MAETFELPVAYGGKELEFQAELLPYGYTHKIKVTIEGIDILFEPDEEKNYRAVTGFEDLNKAGNIPKDLLQAISETLHELFAG